MPLLLTIPPEGCVVQNIPLSSILCGSQAGSSVVLFSAFFPSQCEFLMWDKSEECLVLLGSPKAVISELNLQEWKILRGNRGLRYLRQKQHHIQKLSKGYKITSVALSASLNSMWKMCKWKFWKSGKNKYIALNHGTKECKVRLLLYFRFELQN